MMGSLCVATFTFSHHEDATCFFPLDFIFAAREREREGESWADLFIHFLQFAFTLQVVVPTFIEKNDGGWGYDLYRPVAQW